MDTAPSSPGIGAALEVVAKGIADPGLQAYFAQHRVRFERTLELITAAAPAGSHLLDVGWFPGHLAAALEQLGYRVTGVSSPDIPFEHPDLHLIDIENEPLPFADDTFDGVVFVETIEHLPHSPLRPLREMARVARAGAPLVVTTPNLVRGSNRLKFLLGRSPMFPLDVYWDDDGRGAPLEHRHNREYTSTELRRVVDASGWRAADVGTFVAYAGWLEGDNLPPHRRAIEALKYAAEVAVPGARDSLYVVGRASA